MMFKTQAEYSRYYNEMRKFAQAQATKLSLGWEATEKAMDTLVDWIIANPDADKESLAKYSKTIISNYFTKLSSKRGVELVEHTPDGFTVYEVKDTRKPPKVQITSLPEGQKRDICLMYWQDGMTQQAIADKLGVSKQYISSVIKQYQC